MAKGIGEGASYLIVSQASERPCSTSCSLSSESVQDCHAVWSPDSTLSVFFVSPHARPRCGALDGSRLYR